MRNRYPKQQTFREFVESTPQLRCFVCWITKDEPNYFATSFELQLHQIARHGDSEKDTRWCKALNGV